MYVLPTYFKLEILDETEDVIYKIFPGKKIYINQITIDGNHRTLDQVM